MLSLFMFTENNIEAKDKNTILNPVSTKMRVSGENFAWLRSFRKIKKQSD